MLPLHDDHREVDALLAAVFSSIDSGDAVQALKDLDVFWARLAMHIRAEHLHLFPRLVEKNKEAELIDTVSALRHDHDFFMRELSSMIKLLREEDDRVPENLGTCRSKLEAVRERLMNHNEIEEETVYPLAEKGFDPGEMEELSGLIQKELDNLPPRLRALSANDKD